MRSSALGSPASHSRTRVSSSQSSPPLPPPSYSLILTSSPIATTAQALSLSSSFFSLFSFFLVAFFRFLSSVRSNCSCRDRIGLGEKSGEKRRLLRRRSRYIIRETRRGVWEVRKRGKNIKKKRKFIFFLRFFVGKSAISDSILCRRGRLSQIFLIFQISHPLGLLPHLLPQISQLTRCTVQTRAQIVHPCSSFGAVLSESEITRIAVPVGGFRKCVFWWKCQVGKVPALFKGVLVIKV